MKILIADDDDISRLLLRGQLTRQAFEVVAVTDGEHAWQMLQADDAPRLAILDWTMPGLDGVEVCRRVRATPALQGMYLILLTAHGSRKYVLEGLRAGANDYVTKPFDAEELQARLSVGMEMVRLQQQLAEQVRALQDALTQVKQLQGLLPICSYCKSIRDDQNYWCRLEEYLVKHSDAQFSHGICPHCWNNVVKPEAARHGIEIP